MKKTKKIVSILLTLCLMVSAIPMMTFTSSAAGTPTVSYREPTYVDNDYTKGIASWSELFIGEGSEISQVYTQVTDQAERWTISEDGWYVVGADYNGDNVIDENDAQVKGKQTLFTLYEGLIISADVKFIIVDGFTLNINRGTFTQTGTSDKGTLFISDNSKFTVYGQPKDTGAVNVSGGQVYKNGDTYNGGGNAVYSKDAGVMTINGSAFTAEGGSAYDGKYPGNGFSFGKSTLIINGGDIKAYSGGVDRSVSADKQIVNGGVAVSLASSNDKSAINGGKLYAKGGDGATTETTTSTAGGNGISGLKIFNGGDITAIGGNAGNNSSFYSYGGYGIVLESVTDSLVFSAGVKIYARGGSSHTTYSKEGVLTAIPGYGFRIKGKVDNDLNITVDGADITAVGGDDTNSNNAKISYGLCLYSESKNTTSNTILNINSGKVTAICGSGGSANTSADSIVFDNASNSFATVDTGTSTMNVNSDFIVVAGDDKSNAAPVTDTNTAGYQDDIAGKQYVSVYANHNNDDCITFSSAETFTLKTNNTAKNWDGKLYYSTDKSTWAEWYGTEITSSTTGETKNLYLYGNSANTKIAYINEEDYTYYNWKLTPSVEKTGISCSGNIETLRGATGNNPSPTKMADYCYANMFFECSSLVSAPALPATTLSPGCYNSMFSSCSNLESAPELPATSLSSCCYDCMFSGCTSLTAPVDLSHVTTLSNYCCQGMYNCCFALKVYSEPTEGYTKEWKIPSITSAKEWNSYMLNSTGGTFTSDPELGKTYYVKNPDCITFSSAEAFTLKTGIQSKNWDGKLYYSTDKAVWTEWDGKEINSSATGKTKNLYLYGNSANTIITGPDTDYAWKLTPSVENTDIYCTGNIETLRGATGDNPSPTPMADICYAALFAYNSNLVSAPTLTATVLAGSCYQSMFKYCSRLATAPELPAMTLTSDCYRDMFASCSRLATAPELPATALTEGCYAYMFYGCSSLATAPDLPATVLALNCYDSMFAGCTSLTVPVDLSHVTTLSGNCCTYMYYNCSAMKVYTEPTEGYKKEWKIPSITSAEDWSLNMLDSTGGTFTSAPEVGVTYYIKSDKAEPACEVNGKQYDTISEAIKGVGSTVSTLKLLKNTKENITIGDNQEITLDLNDKILQGDGTSSVITNNGKLYIVDTSDAKSRTKKYFTGDEIGLWTLAADQKTATNNSVTGGVITGGVTQNNGGGILNSGTLTIDGINIVGNKAIQNGGAISSFQGSSDIKNCCIRNNISTVSGGGIFVESSQLAVYNSEIKNNVSEIGGGIGSASKLILGDGTVVEGNKSTSAYPSAGVFLVNYTNSSLTIKGKVIIKNNITQVDDKTTLNANLCLYGTKAWDIADISEIDAGSEIGVTTMIVSNVTPGKFTATGNTTNLAYFTSDNDGYRINLNSENYLETAKYPINKIGSTTTAINLEDSAMTLQKALAIAETIENPVDYTIIAYANSTTAGKYKVIGYLTTEGWFSLSDYTLEDIKSADDAYVIGTVTNGIDISGATIDGIDDQIFTGDVINPAVTVKYNGATLQKDSDYTVSYSNNIALGTATVTITGIDSYTGTKSINFKIIDNTNPTISGVTNGGVYYVSQKATFSDTISGIASVKVDNVDKGNISTYTFTNTTGSSKEFTVVVTDKGGNSTTYTFTINPISTITSNIATLTVENVNLDNEQAIKDVKKQLEELDLTNATQDEKDAVQTAKNNCTSLLEKITEIKNVNAFNEYKEQQKAELDKLDENYKDLIEEGKKAIDELQYDTEKSLAENKAAVNQIATDTATKVAEQKKADEDSLASWLKRLIAVIKVAVKVTVKATVNIVKIITNK